ncbi:MAG: hypothetical protein KH135_00990 [Firmicutes bacterium]|nr:hypothetical protein [Bacillota bacterium]
MKDEKKDNLFQSVFGNVEAPEEKELVPSSKIEEKNSKIASKHLVVEERETSVLEKENPQLKILQETKREVDTSNDNVIKGEPEKETMAAIDESRVNPIVKIVLIVILIGAVGWAIWNLFGTIIYQGYQNITIEKTRKKEVQSYIETAEKELSKKEEDMEVCYLSSSGRYCSSDKDVLESSIKLVINPKEKFDSGTLFFQGGKIKSGTVVLHGYTYHIKDGVVQKGLVEEKPNSD